MNTIKIKVCGLREAQNIRDVCSLNPDYIGLIFYKKSKRYVPFHTKLPEDILGKSIKATGVFINEPLAEVLKHIRHFNLSAVQLHANESPEYCRQLKQEGIEVIKSFGVSEGFDFGKLHAYQNVVDYFLFDTQTSDHGGSGRLFDWNLLRSYDLTVPYFLSGGIGLEASEALSNFKDERLYAIDVNSRFETTPAIKNIPLLGTFFETLKNKE